KLLEKGVTPCLEVILVGENPASKVYVRNKERACERMGILSETHRLPEDTSEEEILRLIDEFNNDPKVHGILVQLPLPDHVNEEAVINTDQTPLTFPLKKLRRTDPRKGSKILRSK
ncbi:MAG: tetrahydrofolate dehydrogenase/cyclohydrolase catalytic domain-containing protein, partial [bacterium]